MKKLWLLARSEQKKIPESSGIYVITSRYGVQVYVGSTFNFRDRFGKHLSKLIRKKHPNTELQGLFDRKHILLFRVVKECDLVEMVRREQEHIDRYVKMKHRQILNSLKTVRHYTRRKRKC